MKFHLKIHVKYKYSLGNREGPEGLLTGREEWECRVYSSNGGRWVVPHPNCTWCCGHLALLPTMVGLCCRFGHSFHSHGLCGERRVTLQRTASLMYGLHTLSDIFAPQGFAFVSTLFLCELTGYLWFGSDLYKYISFFRSKLTKFVTANCSTHLFSVVIISLTDFKQEVPSHNTENRMYSLYTHFLLLGFKQRFTCSAES